MYFHDSGSSPTLYIQKIQNYFKPYFMIEGPVKILYDTKSTIWANLIMSKFNLNFKEWVQEKYASIITDILLDGSTITFVL